MEEILIYKCKDGTRFDKKSDASKYENTCIRVYRLMSELAPVNICDSNYNYICAKHDVYKVFNIRQKFFQLCEEIIPSDSMIFKECSAGTRDLSYASYVLSNFGYKCLCDADYRFQCIDMDSGKEYSQPFYANHENIFKK